MARSHSRHRAIAAAALAGAALAGAACNAPPPEQPTPPDLSALLAAYETPDRALAQGTIDALVSAIEAGVALIDALDPAIEAFEDVLDGAFDELAPDESETAAVAAAVAGPARRDVSITGDGFVRIRHVCHGPGADAPVDPEANGTAELVVTFSEGGVDPVVFGAVERCRYTLSGSDLELDGALDLHIGDLAQVDSVRESPVLIDLALRFAVDGEVLLDGGFDFRVCHADSETCRAGSLELRLEDDAGASFVFFVEADRLRGGVRAANGTFDCSFSDGVCQDPDGNQITIPMFEL